MLGRSILFVIFICLLVILQIIFLGRHATKRFEIFNNNSHASFVVGFLIYFFVSFIVFIPLIYLNTNEIYFIVFFLIKDGLQIMFLISKRQLLKVNLKGFLLFCLMTILTAFTILFYNFVIKEEIGTQKVATSTFTDNSKLNIWAKIKTVLVDTTKMDASFINSWILGIIVAALSLSVIAAFSHFLVKKQNFVLQILNTFVILFLAYILNYSQKSERMLDFEEMANTSILIFAALTLINIVIYSRRRYGTIFGILTFISWGINPNYFLALLVIGLSTVCIYAVFKKPKPLVFWVQILAPLAIESTFWLFNISQVLSFVIIVVSVTLYILFTRIGRLEKLDQINALITKWRYLLPIIIVAGIAITTIIQLPTSQEFESSYDFEYVLSSRFKSFGIWLDIGICIGVFAITAGLCLYWGISKKIKYRKKHFFALLTLVCFAFGLNPVSMVFFKQIGWFTSQEKYINFLGLPIVFLLLFAEFMNFTNKGSDLVLKKVTNHWSFKFANWSKSKRF